MTHAIAILVGLHGCGVPLPAPTLESVEPGRGWNGEDTRIAIAGQGFVPQIRFDASTEGQADLDRDFMVFLVDAAGEEHPLSGVSVDTYEQLSAIVTAGLTPATYDLLVVSPGGARTSLGDAFVVSNTRADHLVLATTEVSYELGDDIVIDASLFDPNGERVLEDVQVRLTALGADGPVLVNWGAGGLEDRVESTDHATITGHLGSDGNALVVLQVFEPETVTITLTALSDPGLLGDELKVAVVPASAFQVDIALPSEPFEAVAGVPFDVVLTLEDSRGEPLPERIEEVLLEDACGSWFTKVNVVGSATVSVTLGVPTGAEPCLVESLVVDGQGASSTFTVVPGPPVRFVVAAGPPVVVAGNEVSLVISAQDQVGNATPWSGVLSWNDGFEEGTLTDCTAVGTQQLCYLVRTVARAADVVRVVGDDGTTGASQPFTVVPAPVAASLTLALPAVVEAGLPARLSIGLDDAFGNPLDPSLWPSDDYALTDDLGELDCTFVAFEADLTGSWDCTLFTSGPAVIHVSGPDGTSADVAFTVTNGPPEVAVFDVPVAVDAGGVFVISGDVEDAWGNPAAVVDSSALVLTDDTFTLTPGVATIEATGSFDVAATITAAGPTRIEAWQDGRLLGTSPEIAVLAGEAVRLGVEPDEPWVWVGDDATVAIEALDAWDNRASWTGTVDLVAGGLAAPGVAVVDGFGMAVVAWAAPVVSEVIDASSADAVFEGTSRPFHVVEDCDVDPVPVLLFAGEPVGRGCWDPAARRSSLTGSFGGSVSAGSPLEGYALAVGDEVITGVDPAPSVTVRATGRFDVRGLVMQADGCGGEVATTAWVGPDDGSPVGPLTVVPVTTPIDVLIGVTDVEVNDARDCSGDVAAFGTVFLRTDRGDLSGVTATGAGLALALDAAGYGVASLSAASALNGGDATIAAWVDDNAAAGVALVAVAGDSLRPQVWVQDPEGETLEIVDTIRLTLSEPLRAASVNPGAVDLVGPFGPETVAVYLEDGETTLVIVPDVPLDGAIGTWDLVLSDEVRDAAGNRLDGAFTGSATDWVAEIGGVSGGVTGATCARAADVIRPDGDPGLGAEADVATVTATAATAPDRWEVAVRTAGEELVRWREVASAASQVLVWDARDATGRVVANGAYDIEITPLDAAGNRGTSCSVTTTVDNPEVTP